MTPRAIILGSILAALLGGLGYVNNEVLCLTFLTNDHFPISVFGLLVVGAIAVNPLMGRLWPAGKFRPPEIAIIVAMMLAVCSIPGSGLLRTFTPMLVMPKVFYPTELAWQKAEVFNYLPPRMIPGGRDADSRVMEGFLGGSAGADRPGVPWAQWAPPLATWMPILALLAVAIICMSLIVHRQWSARERLRYPIALFASALLNPRQSPVPIHRDGMFWLGLIAVFLIHVVNGLYAWFPGFVEIPLHFDFSAIQRAWPELFQSMNALHLVQVRVFPVAAAFGVLLASDVGLSLGISNLTYVLVMAALVAAGLDFSGDSVGGGPVSWAMFGAYAGIAAIVLYTGRASYGRVAAAALGWRGVRDVEGFAVWACRIFLLAAGGLTLLLWNLGLAWPLAVLMVLGLLMMFLVMARLNAEAGLFFVQPGWMPLQVLVALLGLEAIGPQAIMLLMMLSVVLSCDGREALMPYVVNGLKICDDCGTRPARTGWTIGAVHLAVLALAVAVVLQVNYRFGIQRTDFWATDHVPKANFGNAARAINHLRASDTLEASASLAPWQRLTSARPSGRFLVAAGVGLALVLTFSYLRLRLPWWPLHPVLFLVWGTYPGGVLANSFLLGWLIRTLTVKLGGTGAYRRLTVLVTGVIAGDILGGLLWIAVGGAYFGATGQMPKVYFTTPH